MELGVLDHLPTFSRGHFFNLKKKFCSPPYQVEKKNFAAHLIKILQPTLSKFCSPPYQNFAAHLIRILQPTLSKFCSPPYQNFAAHLIRQAYRNGEIVKGISIIALTP